LRHHHYAYRTERTYCDWIPGLIRFFDSQKHAEDMGKKEIESFLSHRALKEKVASATQPHALNAIIFRLLFHNPIHNLLD